MWGFFIFIVLRAPDIMQDTKALDQWVQRLRDTAPLLGSSQPRLEHRFWVAGLGTWQTLCLCDKLLVRYSKNKRLILFHSFRGIQSISELMVIHDKEPSHHSGSR